MRIECEICGAYTEDPKEIEWAKKHRICPECRHIGSLFIAEEDEDLDFENEYEALCYNAVGILIHEYSIEADHTLGAATAAEEFFRDDYPNEVLSTIRVIIGDSFEDYNVRRK